MNITSMILLFLLVLSQPAIAEDRSPVLDRSGVNTADLRVLLNSFAALGEGHVESVLHGLRLISATKEARSGEWEKMKGLLDQFKAGGIKASAVWFLKPDGALYVVDKGLSDQNLSDRSFFPRLMEGEEIKGDLVIGKMTGMRNAVVAVPIKKSGKIIGAIGVHLALDELSRMIDQEMGLPSNMFFYALDQKGQTSLHKVSALIMAYPSDMGSKSLAKTVGEMLARPEGVVTYDFYGERTVVYKKFPLTGWVYAVGVVTERAGEHIAELPPILSELEKEITAELDKMDKDIAGVATRFSETALRTAGTRKMLDDLCRPYPYAVDCSFVDRNGKMVMVEPVEYAGFEGSDISTQEQMVRLRDSKKPVLSNAFRAVEGFEAVDLEHPVFSSRNEFEGSVSLLIRPESLFSHILAPFLQGMPVEAFVMQPDGRILYDEDKGEIGRMLFDDPVYKQFPQLLALGTFISKEKKGSGSYDYKQKGTEKVVKKDAHWATVGLHGTEWRLVVMHVRAGDLSSGKDLAAAGTASYDYALRTLAENAEMKKAMAGNDHAKIRDIFRHFYSVHNGLYSVQWLDARGTNRYGFPEENSLVNLDMKTVKTPSAEPMLQALSDKKESTFDSPLFEGKTGTFFMVPVYEGGDYLGMIYTIRLKE